MGVRGQRGRRVISEHEWARMKRLYETHGNCGTVAEIMGISRNTVQRARRRGFAPTPPDPRRLPVPTDFKLRAAEMSNEELKAHYGVSLRPLHRWLRESGLSDPARGIHKPAVSHRVYKSIPIPPNLGELIERHGVMGTAELVGVNHVTIYKWRLKLGLPIKHKRKKAQSYYGWVDRIAEQRRAA